MRRIQLRFMALCIAAGTLLGAYFATCSGKTEEEPAPAPPSELVR